MNRFALSVAGIATVSMGSSALAAVVNGAHGLDRWAGEHSWQIASSGGSVVASMYVSGSLLYNGVSNFSYTTASASSHWGTVTFTMDLAAGDYTATMQDSYGDGWSWNSYQGYLAVSGSAISGGAASGTVTGFVRELRLHGHSGTWCHGSSRLGRPCWSSSSSSLISRY